MTDSLPNLQALALFVAVVDEGSLGAAARKLGMYQPNASRMITQLETSANEVLLDRHPRGSRPTSAGVLFAAHARTLLEAAREFEEWLRHSREDEVVEIRVGASLTIAENLMPAWLTELRRRLPRVRADLEVLNSAQVLAEVEAGSLQVGFVETPRVPGWLNTLVVQEDELVVVTAANHPWAARPRPLGIAEVAATPLISREGGSGTRHAFEELVGQTTLARPAQTFSSNAAVRVAVAAGAGPAVLSSLAVHAQLQSGELVRVPLAEAPLRRPLTAVWTGPHRLVGPVAELVAIARR